MTTSSAHLTLSKDNLQISPKYRGAREGVGEVGPLLEEDVLKPGNPLYTSSSISGSVSTGYTSTGHLLVTFFECPFVNWSSVLIVYVWYIIASVCHCVALWWKNYVECSE